jgi:hypothetical protein
MTIWDACTMFVCPYEPSNAIQGLYWASPGSLVEGGRGLSAGLGGSLTGPLENSQTGPAPPRTSGRLAEVFHPRPVSGRGLSWFRSRRW